MARRWHASPVFSWTLSANISCYLGMWAMAIGHIWQCKYRITHTSQSGATIWKVVQVFEKFCYFCQNWHHLYDICIFTYEWQRVEICGVLLSMSQQLGPEPPDQADRQTDRQRGRERDERKREVRKREETRERERGKSNLWSMVHRGLENICTGEVKRGNACHLWTRVGSMPASQVRAK